MRIQSCHTADARALDAYFTPREATDSLIRVESLPRVLREPAAGDGAIVTPLREAGHTVTAADIYDYGAGFPVENYLTAAPSTTPIVTNPPFRLALKFAQKALAETDYVALLLRTNFLESTSRLPFFRRHPPARIWISSRRLPMMHRHGWAGPRAPSNTCHAWFIWDAGAERSGIVGWFDWRG
jgi:hypothetical protein